MSWIQVLLEWLRTFWPFEMVYSYQRGIRFWLGVDTKELEPGLYMFVPFFGHIEVVNVAPDVLKLYDQAVTTKDGVGVMLAANVCFRVVDARKSFIEVQELHTSISDIFRQHINKRVRAWTWEELLEKQSDLESSARKTMTTAVKDWGVEVDNIGFVSFVKTRNFSLANL